MGYKFVVLEGIDGCGKATQAEWLQKTLKRLRQPASMHKYPTKNAKKVHEHLSGQKQAGADELLGAFLDDIASHQARLLQDMKKGWVIADRYAISTAAYQGTGGKLEERIRKIEEKKLVRPDVVIWLDLPVDEAMERKAAQKRPDAHESDRLLLEEVRGNYDELYRRSFLSSNWQKVDATQSPKKIAAEIMKMLGG